MSRMPGLVLKLRELAQRHGIDLTDAACHLQPAVQGRSCHCEWVFPRAPDDAAAAARLDAFVGEAAVQLARAGAFFSRPYGDWARIAYAGYPGGVDLLRRLKGVFDPHGLFNPGRLCF
jgi:FAD/FMN-containing dehydrogenase